MQITKDELLERLPPKRDFWFTHEVASVFGVNPRSIQRVAKNHSLGIKVRRGPHGAYVFQLRDLEGLCTFVHGEVGNPINIAISRSRRELAR